MIRSRAVKRHAIKIELDGYLYLQNRLHKERCGEDLSESHIERLTANFKNHYKTCELTMDGDYGGTTDGTPQGKWTSWTVEQMAEMLTEAGIKWTPADDVECIDISI